ncbi:hypothetical protein GOP47_0020715 [Adiantum capillus-veneris]|uniref:F-box domain-containing protein n=1 Tax=Adiantum capillus-veneris TaxID=13818 RepID=A0A9D4Z7Q3_ADICA|nr:hypothetical protein GOP47_0020715 [Adiantum capillus-veneris]
MAASVRGGGKVSIANESVGSPSSSATKDISTSLPSLSPAFELLELPRDCLVRVLSALSAPDVCRMARVCRTLRAIADSNDLWASRLPSDAAFNPLWLSLPRKDLYFRLCAGLLRKDISQPYWMDPETGEGCFVKSARDLTIVWGDDPRYWRWESQPDSWFVDSAHLRDVCWFEVRGVFEGVFLPGTYTVSFRMKFADTSRGWGGAPVSLSLSTSNGHSVESQRFFHGMRNQGLANLAPLRQLLLHDGNRGWELEEWNSVGLCKDPAHEGHFIEIAELRRIPRASKQG